MAKLTKKQRHALIQIDKLMQERKRNHILAAVGVLVMAVLIAAYNQVTYVMGIVTDFDAIIRGALYVIAAVIAGFVGIMMMKASQKKQKIDGFRQANSISRDALEAWRRGEIE